MKGQAVHLTYEMKRYRAWYNKQRPDLKLIDESKWCPGYPDLHRRELEQKDFAYRILDHGFIVDRVCCLARIFPQVEGVELGVVSRTYATDEQIAEVSQGLGVIELPYKVDAGRAFLFFVSTDGAGTRDLINAMQKLPGDMLPYVLPLGAPWSLMLEAWNNDAKITLIERAEA